MENITVSIIIPSFNNEKTIKRALTSAFSQKKVSLEVILIDDCSSDNTINLAQDFRDKRLSILCNQKNVGPADSRNIGISKAKGKWIQFLDADDEISHNKCYKQIQYAGNADWVVSDWNEIDVTNNKSAMHKPELLSGTASIKEFIKKNPIPIHAALIKTSLIKKSGGFDRKFFHEDWEFWIRLSSYKPLIKYHPFICCTYYRQAGSKSYNKKNNLIQQIACLKQIKTKKYSREKKIQRLIDKHQRELLIRLAGELIKANDLKGSIEVIKNIDPPLKIIEHLELYIARTPHLSKHQALIFGPKKITRYLNMMKRSIIRKCYR
jgi:succinoglycan biosynthesis protein ExoO